MWNAPVSPTVIGCLAGSCDFPTSFKIPKCNMMSGKQVSVAWNKEKTKPKHSGGIQCSAMQMYKRSQRCIGLWVNVNAINQAEGLTWCLHSCCWLVTRQTKKKRRLISKQRRVFKGQRHAEILFQWKRCCSNNKPKCRERSLSACTHTHTHTSTA